MVYNKQANPLILSTPKKEMDFEGGAEVGLDKRFPKSRDVDPVLAKNQIHDFVP